MLNGCDMCRVRVFCMVVLLEVMVELLPAVSGNGLSSASNFTEREKLPALCLTSCSWAHRILFVEVKKRAQHQQHHHICPQWRRDRPVASHPTTELLLRRRVCCFRNNKQTPVFAFTQVFEGDIESFAKQPVTN